MFKKIGFEETLDAASSSEHYRSGDTSTPLQGRGVAAGFWMNGGGQSAATLTVRTDGTVSLMEGSADIGGSRASMAMIVAETLGLAAEDITPMVVDTDSIGFTDGTGGSRVTYATGEACYQGALDVLEKMRLRAAKQLEVEEGDVTWRDGHFTCASDPDKSLTFKQVAAEQGSTGGPIEGCGTVNSSGAGNTFAAHVVDLEVDPETGKVQILRYTAVQDCGKAIHPSYVEGQIQGGVVQGIGWALTEGYFYKDDGSMANPTFLDYRMPTSLDLPMIDVVLVEVANPGSPHGIRGVGEVPIVPPLAAISNALYDATGVRFTQTPITPDLIVAGLQSAQTGYQDAAG